MYTHVFLDLANPLRGNFVVHQNRHHLTQTQGHSVVVVDAVVVEELHDENHSNRERESLAHAPAVW